VYEHILGSLEEQVAELPRREFRKLTNLLRRDGYVFEHGRLAPVGGLDLKALAEPPSGVDRATLADHLRRIQQSVDSDPAQAIGSAKELVESVAKSVLASFGQDNDKDETLPQLVKRAMKSLDLSIEDLPEAKKGADSIRKVLAGLGQIVSGTAELRNLYGTGHGRLRTGGLQPRHARLVVGAADTFVRFLLDTLEVRQPLRR
jgi:Abortive infection C-terminus